MCSAERAGPARWSRRVALAIGAIVDIRRDSRGVAVAPDSPVAETQLKRARKEAKRAAKNAS